MTMNARRRWSAVVGVCAALSMLAACGLDREVPAGPAPDKEVAAQSSQQAASASENVGALTFWGWTNWTSEENPPIYCDTSALVRAARCRGSYCDDISLFCEPTRGVRGNTSYWTNPISEEWPNFTMCAGGYWMAGLSCTGSYCDNVSIHCAQMNNIVATDCLWTGYFSEEQGGFLAFPAGYYARGVRCTGDYCDNMSYYICRAL